MNDALLLNSSYEPMHILDWKNAINLLFREKIEVLESHEMPIRTPSGPFLVPAVCRLKEYVNIKRVTTKFNRENIFRRDSYSCLYCGGTFNKKDLTYDHIIPKSKGGKTTWLNIASACKPCNSKKGDKTLQEADIQLLQKPYVPKLDKKLYLRKDAPRIWKHYLW